MPFCAYSEHYFMKKCKKICTYRKKVLTLCDFWLASLRKPKKNKIPS